MDNKIFKPMVHFVEKFMSSISMTRSSEADLSRKAANKKYAESTGEYYDDELGSVLHTLDFSDVDLDDQI